MKPLRIKKVIPWIVLVASLAACTTPARQVDEYSDALALYDNHQYDRALPIFRRLAEAGVPSAQNNLGTMYRAGQGVPQDYQQALHWFGLAASQDNATAQANLGYMYYRGEGVDADIIEACKWLLLSQYNGNKSALVKLNQLGEKMTQEQVDEARKRAQEWRDTRTNG